MSSHLDYVIINIMVHNSKGAYAYLEQTSVDSNLCNPFPNIVNSEAIYYKGNIKQWILQLIKFAHLEVTLEFETILDDIQSADAVYQEVSCHSTGCFCRYHWSKNEGMHRSNISIDMNHIEKLLYQEPSIDYSLWEFSNQILEQSLSEITTTLGKGFYQKIEIEFSQKELQEMNEEKWHALFSPVFEESFISDFNEKTFVICEANYRYAKNSEGKRLAKKLIEIGAKESSRISAKTNYLIVSTKKISALHSLCSMAALSDDELKLWIAKNGKPLLWTAVEMKKAGHPIQIITIENALQYLDNIHHSNQTDEKKHILEKAHDSSPREDDWEEIIQTLVSYYTNKPSLPGTIKELENNHPEYPWKKLSVYTMRTYHESAQVFLLRKGLLQPVQSAEQKLEETIALLKKRYEDRTDKAFTMLDLEIQNPDISINQLTNWINKTTNFSPADYLMRTGILVESEWMKRYRENNQIDINHEYLKHAFANIDLDNLKGKKCILLEDCDWGQDKLLTILDFLGVIIETEFTNSTDYVITSTHHIQISPPLGNPIIDAAVKKISMTKEAMFVSVYDILKQAANLRATTIITKSFEEKNDYALKMFDICIAKLTKEMGNVSNFDDPVTQKNMWGFGRTLSSPEWLQLEQFVESLRKHLETKYSSIFNETYTAAKYGQWLSSLIHTLSPGLRLPSMTLYQALGFAITYLVFISPGSTIELEFVGNRHDLNFDYCRGERVYILLSNSSSEIEVGTRFYY